MRRSKTERAGHIKAWRAKWFISPGLLPGTRAEVCHLHELVQKRKDTKGKRKVYCPSSHPAKAGASHRTAQWNTVTLQGQTDQRLT